VVKISFSSQGSWHTAFTRCRGHESSREERNWPAFYHTPPAPCARPRSPTLASVVCAGSSPGPFAVDGQQVNSAEPLSAGAGAENASLNHAGAGDDCPLILTKPNIRPGRLFLGGSAHPSCSSRRLFRYNAPSWEGRICNPAWVWV